MYPIEIKMCSKAGYFTPAEARNYYGRYARDGVTVHWWGDGTGEGNHNNIVNYIYNGSVQGQKSVNYVLSDAKITLMVNPDDVAWTSQSGNATTVSVETEPQLSDEGYKKWGWLLNELQGRYGKTLKLYPHNFWYSTACPGTISLDRIRQEQVKWATGAYNPAPTPVPTPTPTPTPPADVKVTFTQIPSGTYVCNKQPTNLYQVNKNQWGEIGVVKTFNRGERVDIYGTVKAPLGEWYVTKYSFDNKIPNGFSKADLDPYIAPVPTPAPEVQPQVVKIPAVKKYTLTNAKLVNIKDGSVVKEFALDTPMDIAGTSNWQGKDYFLTQFAVDKDTKQGFLVGDLKDSVTPANPEPTPNPQPEVPTPAPTDPEWKVKLRDIDDTEYWLNKDQDLIDITTGKPTGTKTFKKDESFVASAVTSANGVEYRITEYSFKKGIYNGVPVGSLTLTKPGVPDVPPVVHDPTIEERVTALEKLVKIIWDYLNRWIRFRAFVDKNKENK